MRDRLRFVVTVLIASVAALAQNGRDTSAANPTLPAVPFDRWLAERNQARFRWSARVSSVALANSQRLQARVEIEVDGNELVKRRGQGELVLFVEFKDSDRHVFRTHQALPLREVTDIAAKSNFVYTQPALVVPGDYRVAFAILDTRTGDHAAIERTLHVAPLRSDPLPDSWTGLPPVEFIARADPPDAWFEPYLAGHLHLPLEMRRPLRVEVLVNASPSAIGPRFRTGQVNSRSLADLLPALKVISQVELGDGMLNVSVFDLTRRQVLFTQARLNPQSQPLDWTRLRPALLEADPNKIDVRDLAHRQENAQFFVEEVRRRIAVECALIVLSGPMEFASGDDLRPIELAQKPPGRVFYIRYHPLPVLVNDVPPRPARPNRGRGFPQPRILAPEPADALEPLLKPLQPRLFDVNSAEQFRKALADLMKEIARM
jgi:hypothetical protein